MSEQRMASGLDQLDPMDRAMLTAQKHFEVAQGRIWALRSGDARNVPVEDQARRLIEELTAIRTALEKAEAAVPGFAADCDRDS